MKFGEITISQILLAAFSGIGLFVLKRMFWKKIINQFRSKDKQVTINQNNNVAKGSIAGGDIIDTDSNEIETQRSNTQVNQVGNIVEGDIAGGNIIKKKSK